jgi:cytochrome c553
LALERDVPVALNELWISRRDSAKSWRRQQRRRQWRPAAMKVSSMRSVVGIALLIGFGAGVVIAASFPPPPWAYGDGERGKPLLDDGKPKRVAGSARSFTLEQIHDSFTPADWYPSEHPPMPAVPVATGRKPDLRACSWCHLPTGLGHSQSGNLAGLRADYLARQLADFKSGARHSSVGNSIMANISRALTPQEAQAAVEYFSKLRQRPWVKVVESDMAPRTVVVEGGLRVQREPLELEPLGERIVEVPQDPARTRLYDAHAGFVAYVPKGSVARGKAFVAMPDKAVSCTECHGKDLRGAEHAPDSTLSVPGLRGRSPTYIMRQLYDFHSGARSGPGAELMKPVAAQMTLQQMTDVAAYFASLVP